MYPEKYLPQVLVLAILDKYLTNKSYTIDIEIIYIPESSPRALFPPLSKRHKISAPQVDFSPLARFLPLAFLGIDMKRNLPFNH